MLPPSLVCNGRARSRLVRTWQVLPTVTDRATELLTIHDGGYDAATAGLPAAVASRARAVDAVSAWRIPRMLPPSLVGNGSVHAGTDVAKVLPSATDRATGLLTTRGGGYDAALIRDGKLELVNTFRKVDRKTNCFVCRPCCSFLNFHAAHVVDMLVERNIAVHGSHPFHKPYCVRSRAACRAFTPSKYTITEVSDNITYGLSESKPSRCMVGSDRDSESIQREASSQHFPRKDWNVEGVEKFSYVP